MKTKNILVILVTLLATAGLTSCSESAIYDYDECDYTAYYVEFVYDMNLKYADAFPAEVSSVSLFLLDASGNVVWQKSESGEALATGSYRMSVDVEPGTYSLVAWCGLENNPAFSLGTGTRAMRSDLTCALDKSYSNTLLGGLYHGYLADQTFPAATGKDHTYTVHLTKDVNEISVVLQQTAGNNSFNPDDFTIEITDDNSLMDWDNSIVENGTFSYTPWATSVASVEGYVSGDYGIYGTNGLLAELSTARLMADHKTSTRLSITRNDTGGIIISIPLIQYLTMIKGEYRKDMDDQEYLDRQDEFSIVFFLTDDREWMNQYIYVNSWKVVLQNSEL